MCAYDDLTPRQKTVAKQITVRRVLAYVIETRGRSLGEGPIQEAVEQAIDANTDGWGLGMDLMVLTYRDENHKQQKVSDRINEMADELLSRTQFVDGPVIMMSELK
jgi:hypothetical protein